MTKNVKFLLALTALTTPFVSVCDDASTATIIIKPGTQKKKIPPKYPSLIHYCHESSEACLSTSMPYTCAVIEAADIDGYVYSSIVVTPEETCGYLDLQPSSTITVTFDNGTVLTGSY